MSTHRDPYSGKPAQLSRIDGFDDDSISTNIWGTKVEDGSSLISETGGQLKIANDGGGTTGTSHLPSKYADLGKMCRNSVDIKVEDGHEAADGEHFEASLVLWIDADNYIKFGPYRDTGEAINSNGYLRYNIAGAGEVVADIAGEAIDSAIKYTYSIVILEYEVLVYLDGIFETSFEFPDMIAYNAYLQAGTELDADVMDVRFDDYEVFQGFDPALLSIGAMLVSFATDTSILLTRLTESRAGYLDNLAASEIDGTYEHANGVAEEDAVLIAPTEITRYNTLMLDLSNITKITTIRTYVQVDGSNYRLFDTAVFPTDFDANTVAVPIGFPASSKDMKVTMQSSVAEGAARDVPYFYITGSLA